MGWWSRRGRAENVSYSISDPAFAGFVSLGSPNYSGVNVGEGSALAISAFYRAVSLISGTLAGLPQRTLRDVNGVRTRVNSFLDAPGGLTGPTPFEWRETVYLHLLLHGNAYLMHMFSGAGSIAALVPLHPLCVMPEWADVPGGKLFTATLLDGTQKTFDSTTMTHIPAASLDGLKGMSVISVARNSLGTAIAGDRAASKMFADGALMSGVMTPEEDVTKEEAKVIKESLNQNVTGWENANAIAVINRKMKFQPWSLSMEDAQFLQSRQFQIEEISRWTGVPPHLLMQTEKQTSWGTGVAEQNRGLARYTLSPWSNRMDDRLSRLLPAPRFVETDYVGLLKPAPEQEIPLLLAQVNGGVMTVNEMRRIRGMDPIDGGDVLQKQTTQTTQPEPVPA